MVVCMPTTVAGGGRKCYDFCGRWGFDEAQDLDSLGPAARKGLAQAYTVCTRTR